MQLENAHLRHEGVEHRFKISVYESLLRRLGVDPDVAVAAIRTSAKPVPKAKLSAVAANRQLQPPQQSKAPCSAQPRAELPQQAARPLQPVAVAQLVGPAAADPAQGCPPGGASSF